MIRPYWKKISWKTNYIIVAPHAAWDDYNTWKLAYYLAEKLDAFCVVNEMYIKPENTRKELLKNVVENFNRLPWDYEEKSYKWENIGKNIRIFFEDIVDFSNEIRNNLWFSKTIIVFVHWLRYETWVDIWIWKSIVDGEIIKESSEWNIKFPIEKAIELQKYFNEILQKHNFECHIGKHFNAWYMRNWVQYFDWITDLAIQFELNKFLREHENIEYTAEILSKWLKKIWQ